MTEVPPGTDLDAAKRALWPHADPAAITSIEQDPLGGPEIAHFADGYRMPLKPRITLTGISPLGRRKACPIWPRGCWSRSPRTSLLMGLPGR